MSAYESLAYANESESESEQEAFFNHLAAAADRSGRPQSLRRVALAAAREAFRGAASQYPAIEGESELELENEFEFESVRPGEALAQMEHMAHEAVNSEGEQEAAEQFLPLIPLAAKALLPLAMKALPVIGKIGAKVGGKLLGKIAPKLLKKVVPNLTRGVSRLARGLFRNRSTRPLLRAVPNIARRTMNSLTKQIASGRRVTPQTAARALARQTRQVLGNPRQLQTAYRRSQLADSTFHQSGGTGVSGGCPTCGSGRPVSGPVPRPRPAFTATPAISEPGCKCRSRATCPCCGR